jgi:hypothetical protein
VTGYDLAEECILLGALDAGADEVQRRGDEPGVAGRGDPVVHLLEDLIESGGALGERHWGGVLCRGQHLRLRTPDGVDDVGHLDQIGPGATEALDRPRLDHDFVTAVARCRAVSSASARNCWTAPPQSHFGSFMVMVRGGSVATRRRYPST